MFQEYDFVFNVDIEDGKPPLKLPYNSGEDPWFVAQEFIHKHNLSQQFLEQIANFIVTNSKQDSSAGSSSNQQFCDPFTGMYNAHKSVFELTTLFEHIALDM